MKKIIGVSLVAAMLFSMLSGFSIGVRAIEPFSQAVAPVASPNGGNFTSSVFVRLTCATTGVNIYYTTDGTAPTAESAKYSALIELTNTTTIRAIAIGEGLVASEVLVVTFTKQSGGSVPNDKPGDVPVGDKGTVPGGGGGTVPDGGEETTPTDIEDDDLPLSFLEDAGALAGELYKLGLFLGIGDDEDGNPNFDLDNSLTRLQALILTIRLLGLEEEALDYTGELPLNDVPAWGVPYVAYGFANGITNGTSATTFSPNQNVTCQQFTAFLVRILGYNENSGDFSYVDTLKFALSIELFDETTLDSLDEGVFLRSKAVASMVRAMTTLIKGSDKIKLIDTLVDAEVVTEESALAFIEAIVA